MFVKRLGDFIGNFASTGILIKFVVRKDLDVQHFSAVIELVLEKFRRINLQFVDKKSFSHHAKSLHRMQNVLWKKGTSALQHTSTASGFLTFSPVVAILGSGWPGYGDGDGAGRPGSVER